MKSRLVYHIQVKDQNKSYPLTKNPSIFNPYDKSDVHHKKMIIKLNNLEINKHWTCSQFPNVNAAKMNKIIQ